MPVARSVIVPVAAVDAPDPPKHPPVGIHVRLSRKRRRVEVEQQAVGEGEVHGGGVAERYAIPGRDVLQLAGQRLGGVRYVRYRKLYGRTDIPPQFCEESPSRI